MGLVAGNGLHARAAEAATDTVSKSTAYHGGIRTPRPRKSFLTTMQVGHGWTLAGGKVTSFNPNDAVAPALGSQSLSWVTNGLGSTYQRGIFASPAFPAVDLTKSDVMLLLKVDDVSKLLNATLRMSSVGDVVTAANYQSLSFNGTQGLLTSGKWDWVHITTSAAAGAGSRAAVTKLGLVVQDTTGPCTVHLGAVALIPKSTTQYPHGVITLGFDDGYADQFSAAAPIMDRHGFPGTAYVIHDQIVPKFAGGAYLGMEQLKQLRDVRGWDICAHSATTASHNSVKGFDGLTAAQVDVECSQMKEWLVTNGFERGVDHFAYPQGYHSEKTMDVVRQYFTSARTTDFAPTALDSLPPSDLLKLKVRPLDMSATTSFTSLIDNVYAEGGWLNLYTHRVTATPSGTQITAANFKTVVDYIAAKGVPVLTLPDVLNSLGA